MPSAKTVATELSVGFGLLGISDPTAETDYTYRFEGTLSPKNYSIYLHEYARSSGEYQRFIRLGEQLRRVRFGDNVPTVRWTGNQPQAATIMASKDLFIPAANTPISVKYNSHVVANPSPHNLFRSLPSGAVVASQAPDWFIEKDYDGIQALYAYASSLYNAHLVHSSAHLPEDIRNFYRETNRLKRREFQTILKNRLTLDETSRFNQLYVQMCDEVARSSAQEFNDRLVNLPARSRPAVHETIVKQFFRINAVEYILAGLDRNQPFAVRIPDLTAWKRDWSIQRLHAQPRLGRGQSVVGIEVEIQNKISRERVSLPFHVEIRWSHGKFCGNPEGKLYKEFSWVDAPFFAPVL